MPGVKTQGTHIFLVDNTASAPTLFKMSCPTGITGLLSGSTDEIDTTCLDASSRTFELGLSDQGEMSVPFIFNPEDNGHRTLFDLVAAKRATEILIGLSDGTAIPTLDSNGAIVAPANRTSFKMSALVKNPPFDFASNEVVRSTLALRVSGTVTVTFRDGQTKEVG